MHAGRACWHVSSLAVVPHANPHINTDTQPHRRTKTHAMPCHAMPCGHADMQARTRRVEVVPAQQRPQHGGDQRHSPHIARQRGIARGRGRGRGRHGLAAASWLVVCACAGAPCRRPQQQQDGNRMYEKHEQHGRRARAQHLPSHTPHTSHTHHTHHARDVHTNATRAYGHTGTYRCHALHWGVACTARWHGSQH